MMNPRYKASEAIMKRSPKVRNEKQLRAREIFGENVFHKAVMRRYLPDQVYQALINAMENGEVLDSSIAAPVAEGIKAWAIDKGATHFTHWFQPLTGRTAEKHESFLDFFEGEAIDKFSGGELSQQEPDASSFPSGGLRTTFEARGYTAWDSSSPVFILDTTFGTTLCIPTIFVSYTGKSLDYKMPLLKSISRIDKASVELCRFFGMELDKVSPTLGLEQEYFLIDKQYYYLRPDLYQTGRTLFGAAPARGQQLYDHYFGAIPERVYAFMNEVEYESHRLGIPLKTRHNEVAPAQFECAPRFERMNVAIDHGLMIMDLIDRIAQKHDFVVLLHEKPFAGINGSGKHNNWSLRTNTGKNLLAPGKKPEENLVFLSFFVSVIRAVYQYADLLRASVVSAGNDHRLGSHEAPPAIISVFLGHQLDKVLNDIEHPPRKKKNVEVDFLMHLGIASIPELLLDNTDRNRTSPFAFTGNKFEFRAVGASANSSLAMTVLNTIVAEQLEDFRIRVKSKMNRGRPQDAAVVDMLREFIIDSKSIRFEGDSYSTEWKKLAQKRKLSPTAQTPEALDALISEEALNLFERQKVMSKEEAKARQEVLLEKYLRQVEMEGQVIEEVIMTQVFPLVQSYQQSLVDLWEKKKSLGGDRFITLIEENLLSQTEEAVKALWVQIGLLKEAREQLGKETDLGKKARMAGKNLFPVIGACREGIDLLEGIIPDADWPFPKYREMLLVK